MGLRAPQPRRFICKGHHDVFIAQIRTTPTHRQLGTTALRLARRRIAGAALVLLACAPLAAFALAPADVAPLAADDFDAKSAAIDKLIANADAPSVAVLNALSDGSLVATDAGDVLLQDRRRQQGSADRQDRQAPATRSRSR